MKLNPKLNFQGIRECLSKIKASQEAEQKLEQEREALTQAILEFVNAGNDDPALIKKASEDEMRLKLFPAKIAKQKEATTAAMEELGYLMNEARLQVSKSASEVTRRIGDEISEFLGRYIKNGHEVQEIARDCVQKTDAVKNAEALASSMALTGLTGGRPDALLMSARRILGLESES